MCAIDSKHPVAILREFIKLGSDLNVRDTENSTMGMHAVRSLYDAKTVAMLTTQDTVNAENNKGESIMMLAFKYGTAEQVFDALMDKFPNLKLEQVLFTAIDIGNEALVEKLIKAGVDVNIIAPDGRTPLICAAQTKHVKKIDLIITALKTSLSLQDLKYREANGPDKRPNMDRRPSMDRFVSNTPIDKFLFDN